MKTQVKKKTTILISLAVVILVLILIITATTWLLLTPFGRYSINKLLAPLSKTFPSITAGNEFQLSPLELLNKESLIGRTPFFTKHFSVEYDSKTGEFIVKLYAILNRPDQFEKYNQDLIDHKAEVMAWLESQNVDPATLPLRFMPPEAQNL